MAAIKLIPIWIWRLLFLAGFVCVWEFASGHGYLNPILVGNPSGIFDFLIAGLFKNQELVGHLMTTLLSTLIAFVGGSLSGILIGLLCVSYPTVEKFMDPLFAGLNALPRIALAPLFLLWFGLGISSKIALGISLTFFIVLSSTIAGARGVSADHIVLARTIGASSLQTFTRITLPSAVPTIFSGLRLGLIYALLGVIGGELIAAQKGLG